MIEEVRWYRTENPTVAMSKVVVKFANTPDPASNRLYKIQDATKWKAVGRQRIDFSRKLMKI
jgi:hypothetical protein